MLAPVLHIHPLTLVRRTRQLDMEGAVQVRQGQRVQAKDVVATATLHPQHKIINIAEGLGVSRAGADSFIERSMGEVLEVGDVVAKKTGLFNRIIRAPVGGKVVLITSGLVMIEEQVPAFELKAGMPGEIAQLIHNRGVVIEASGALLQCAWGNGQIDSGSLNVLASEPGELLKAPQIDASLRGRVIMGGHCDSYEVFKNCTEHSLRGVILGSMEADLIPQVEKLPYPVVVMEGFSHQNMNEKAFTLLSTNNERDLSLNAEPYKPATGGKPEILIPLPGAESADPLPDIAILGPGAKVKITRPPYRGVHAQVESIMNGRPILLGTLRVPAAMVTLPNGNTVQVPLANLEILS